MLQLLIQIVLFLGVVHFIIEAYESLNNHRIWKVVIYSFLAMALSQFYAIAVMWDYL